MKIMNSGAHRSHQDLIAFIGDDFEFHTKLQRKSHF